MTQEQTNRATYHGTTTAGVVCSDGVVLATDTRVTAGGFVAHKRGKKLLQVDQHLAVTISGGVADAQNVVDSLKYYSGLYRIEKGIPIPVKSAARIVSNILFSSRYYPFIAIVLVGGVDAEGGSIYNLDFFGSMLREKVTATGSGSPVALGVLEDGYRDGINISKGVPLVANAIISAMRRNVFTGDGFDIAVIDDKNGFREISNSEKERLLSQYAGRS